MLIVMLNLYNILKMVEEEIIAMKKRQQFVIGTYQQQTREDIFKKFMQAEHELLAVTEQKVKELNIAKDSIYLITSNRKELTISVRRINDEQGLMVEIDPIIYPSIFNLKFILDEPSVTLYSLSLSKGIVSLNSNTAIRATDKINTITIDELNDYLSLWLEPEKEGLKAKVDRLISKIGSEEFLIESLLALSKDPPSRELIYLCNDHASKPFHNHDKILSRNDLKSIIINHLRL